MAKSKRLIKQMVDGQINLFEEEDRKLKAFKQDTLRYLSAGNATFTLESTKIDKRYTYKVYHRKNDKCENRYIISVMYGPNNNDDFKYLGLWYKDTGVFKVPASRQSTVDTSGWQYKMFNTFIKLLYTDALIPDTCKFYKSGKCACCGRKLTTPESIELGIGPDCYERLMKK